MRTYTRRTLTFKGETKTIVAWANEYGMEYSVVKNRIDMGWSAERALTFPIIYKPRRVTKSVKMKSGVFNEPIESIVANLIRETLWIFKKRKFRALKENFQKNIPGYLHTHWLKVA